MLKLPWMSPNYTNVFFILVRIKTPVVFQPRVNYCSHSSRGAAKGQLRVPGWFWQSGTLETGAHERQSAGIAEAETHGRFSPPAYRGVPNLSPNQSTGRERARDSDVIGAKTAKQRRFSSFLCFSPSFSAVAFTSPWVRRMMWARGAVFPETVARDGGRRQR